MEVKLQPNTLSKDGLNSGLGEGEIWGEIKI